MTHFGLSVVSLLLLAALGCLVWFGVVAAGERKGVRDRFGMREKEEE